MENVRYAIKDGMLLIQVDLAKQVDTFKPKSGNVVVATSDNWVKLPEMPGWNFNMILTRRPDAVVPADSAVSAAARTAS